jgi:hypothetical protein
MTDHKIEEKLIAAYDKMMERVNHLLDTAEQQAIPSFQHNIEKAKQQAVELKEVTKEEAEKIADYLKRDMHDAAEYIEETGKEFSSWASFDLKQVEDRVLEMFIKVADKTRIELAQLAAQAKRAQEYHTGEITSIGTLACVECETQMHFKKTSKIPPCPKCHKTVFKRSRK